MNEQGNIEIDDILLSRYLAGRASPEEAMALEEWLHDSEHNKIIFKQYLEIWHSSANDNFQMLPAEKAWHLLQDRLTSRDAKKLRTIMFIPGIAALFLLVISIILAVLKEKKGTGIVENKTIIKVSNGIEQDTLPDGSIITLQANTSLSYTMEFKQERNVSVKGEAYFNVVRDVNRPFIIKTRDIAIKVLGTSFNVSTKDSNQTDVQVNKGTVLLYTLTNSLTLQSGQGGRYVQAEHKFYLENEIDRNSLGYATKEFYFKDLSLLEVTGYLERAFGYQFKFMNKRLVTCRMSSQFKDKSLSYILNVISLTLNVKCTIKQNIIYQRRWM